MPSIDRIKELERELDKLHKEQKEADERHRHDLDDWKKSGDHKTGKQKNKKYVEGCNDRGRRSQKIWDELSP